MVPDLTVDELAVLDDILDSISHAATCEDNTLEQFANTVLDSRKAIEAIRHRVNELYLDRVRR